MRAGVEHAVGSVASRVGDGHREQPTPPSGDCSVEERSEERMRVMMSSRMGRVWLRVLPRSWRLSRVALAGRRDRPWPRDRHHRFRRFGDGVVMAAATFTSGRGGYLTGVSEGIPEVPVRASVPVRTILATIGLILATVVAVLFVMRVEQVLVW